ncbi:MAG TPA: SUMF1/EgtB/PvdO family nonheme iron enzyme [Humisphaera sp.]|jgi:formylglycine-generating enzyme required for sulfatase activity/Tol biopolymer transport system component|nr:SUMF1/EgtB/PvdO family nonheme iron enzyme [Humisphaera sp.]
MQINDASQPGRADPTKKRSGVGIAFGLVVLVALAGGAFMLRNRPSAPTGPATDVLLAKSGGELVRIPAGEFTMGQEGGRPDETPHVVSVSSFYMDRYLVTQEFYQKIMGTNPSKKIGKQNPVERAQWIDAAKFCNKCSELEGLTPCYDLQTWECRFDADGYRLPTEAEWEYACRAGSHTKYFFGDDEADLPRYAWCKPESEGMVHPVGRKQPNAWGLHDMLGNVWEWCNDWYGDAYPQGTAHDPRGPATGKQRTLRGGAWDTTAENCTPARRFKEFPFFTDACFGADTYGFRRVRSDKTTAKITVTSATAFVVPSTLPSTPSPSALALEFAKASPVAAAPSAAPPGKLQPSQLKGTIIFASDRSGTLNIWSMRADGSEPKALTSDKDPHADPRFSPDGKTVLYTVLRGGFPEIWTMNRVGSAPRKITTGSQADWSPDGQQIAFIRDNQVWVRDLTSSQERRITPEAWERCGVPAWRPDGKQLAVASRHTGSVAIYLLSLDGKQIAPLSTEEESCTPRWSRDGRKLLCQTVKGHVHQVDADGKNWEQVTAGADVQHDAEYSPDGSTVVFCRAPSSEGPWNICVSKLGDEDMDFLQLTKEGSNLQPDWYPDTDQQTSAK